MQPTPRVDVVHLFPEERARLLELLQPLPPEGWAAATSCPGWSVKDIAAHILGDDFGNLAGGRDGYTTFWFKGDDWDELLGYINRQNEAWVQALRRLSPAVLIELLEDAGRRTHAFYGTVDLMSEGPGVAWAGPGPHPMWLHIAREYTERWLHQAQIREAVGAAGLYARRLFHPVLAAFVHALPVAYAATQAPEGTAVAIRIEGEAGGDWGLVRGPDGWGLFGDWPGKPSATVTLDQVTAWKLWTKGMSSEEGRPRVRIEGDQRLGEPALQAVAIIA